MKNLVNHVVILIQAGAVAFYALSLIISLRIKLKICPLREVFLFVDQQSSDSRIYSKERQRLSSVLIVSILKNVGKSSFTTCLPLAFAGKILLAKYGYLSELHIGVKKGAGDKILAHAWLIVDRTVSLGLSGCSEDFQEIKGAWSSYKWAE